MCSYSQNSQAGVSILMVRATDGDGDTVAYTIASGMQYCYCIMQVNVVWMLYKITDLAFIFIKVMIRLLATSSPLTVELGS